MMRDMTQPPAGLVPAGENVLCHAGPATAMVQLTYDEDHLTVQVNDGRGAAAGWPTVGGYGLLSMPQSVRRARTAALSMCDRSWHPRAA
jgi:hypothetical protein